MTTSGEPDSLDEVLCDYLDRLDQGEPVDRAALRARHPQLAQELARFFDDWDAVSQAVHDVRNEALPRENQERDRAGLHQCESGPSGGANLGSSPQSTNEFSLNEVLSCLQHLDELWPDDACQDAAEISGPPPHLQHLLLGRNGSTSALGRFQLRRLLGRGGFGIVFLADDPSLCRSVALKIPRPEILFSRQVKQRFIREAQLAALLDHPGIVPVYETGEIGPLWYIASAYCSGPTLAAWLSKRQEPAPARLAAHILWSLSGAVQHAHSRGVLHRDLKPSNILLEPIEGSQFPGFSFVPKVTDFGLAVRREEPHDLTRTGMLLGTSRYMAPEQAIGDAKAIGVFTDVYSLGVMLYELLTGRPPFAGKSDSETLRAIQQDPPAEAPLRSRKVHRDLQAVCLKCLAKEPRLRYPTAADLAADLQQYLDGRPVTARSAGRLARTTRWCRRRPAVAALLAGLFIVTLAGALGVLWQWRRAERNYAETHSLLYAANMKLAEAAWQQGNVRAVHQLLEPFDDPPGQVDLRGWEWYFLHRLCNQDVLTVNGRGRVQSLATSPADASVVVGTFANDLWSFDTKTGAKRLALTLNDPVVATAISTDGSRLAALEKGGVLRLWTLAPSPRLTARINLGGDVWTAAFTSSLSRIAAAGEDFTLRVWDLPARSEYRVLNGHTARIKSVSFSADETQLISGSEDGTVRMWDLQQGKQICLLEQPQKQWILSAALSNNGALLAAGSQYGSIIVWDVASQRQLLQLSGHAGSVGSLAFSPDDKRLASASADRTIRVWNMPSGALARTIRGHLEGVNRVAFMHDSVVRPRGLRRAQPSGSRRAVILSGSSDETVRLWDLGVDDFGSPRPRQVNVANVLFADDGRSLACRFMDGTVVVFELPSWRQLLRFRGPGAESAMAYDAKRSRIAVSYADGRIELREGSHRFRQFTGHTADIKRLALSHDGRWLASGSSDQTLKVWDIESGKLSFDSGEQPREVCGAAFSPDSKLLVSVSDGVMSFWDPTSGNLLRRFNGHAERIFNVSFNQTGELIATGDRFGTIMVWDAATGDRRATLTGHTDRAYACSFTPDSRRLVSCGRDGTIRWWDLTTSRELCVIQGEWGSLEWITLSPDGWTLAAINKARELRLWDPRPRNASASVAYGY